MWYQKDASPGAQLTMTDPNCSAVLIVIVSVTDESIEAYGDSRSKANVHAYPSWVTASTLNGHDAIRKGSRCCNHSTKRVSIRSTCLKTVCSD